MQALDNINTNTLQALPGLTTTALNPSLDNINTNVAGILQNMRLEKVISDAKTEQSAIESKLSGQYKRVHE